MKRRRDDVDDEESSRNWIWILASLSIVAAFVIATQLSLPIEDLIRNMDAYQQWSLMGLCLLLIVAPIIYSKK